MSRKILKIKDGKTVATYDSMIEASKENYLDRATIYKRIERGHIDKEGFAFAFAPFTQFDRIKCMSVEEMAEFLLNVARGHTDCRECFAFRYCTFEDCGISFKNWLKSEVEVNEN